MKRDDILLAPFFLPAYNHLVLVLQSMAINGEMDAVATTSCNESILGSIASPPVEEKAQLPSTVPLSRADGVVHSVLSNVCGFTPPHLDCVREVTQLDCLLIDFLVDLLANKDAQNSGNTCFEWLSRFFSPFLLRDVIGMRINHLCARLEKKVVVQLVHLLGKDHIMSTMKKLLEIMIPIGLLSQWVLAECYQKLSVVIITPISHYAIRQLCANIHHLANNTKQGPVTVPIFQPVALQYLWDAWRDSDFYAHQDSLRRFFMLWLESRSYAVYCLKLQDAHYQLHRLAVLTQVILCVGHKCGLTVTEEDRASFLERVTTRFQKISWSLLLVLMPKIVNGEAHSIGWPYIAATDFSVCSSLLQQYSQESVPRVVATVRDRLAARFSQMKIETFSSVLCMTVAVSETDGVLGDEAEYGLSAAYALLFQYSLSPEIWKAACANLNTLHTSMPLFKKWWQVIQRLSVQLRSIRNQWRCVCDVPMLETTLMAQPACQPVFVRLGTWILLFMRFQPVSSPANATGRVQKNDQSHHDMVCIDCRHGQMCFFNHTLCGEWLQYWCAMDVSCQETDLSSLVRLLPPESKTHLRVGEYVVNRKAEHEFILSHKNVVIGTYSNLAAVRRQLRVRAGIKNDACCVGEAIYPSFHVPLLDIAYAPCALFSQEWCRATILPLFSRDAMTKAALQQALYNSYGVLLTADTSDTTHARFLNKERWKIRFSLLELEEHPASHIMQVAVVRLWRSIERICFYPYNSLVFIAAREAIRLDLEDACITLANVCDCLSVVKKIHGCVQEAVWKKHKIRRRLRHAFSQLGDSLSSQEGRHFQCVLAEYLG